jgi:hypothetical protein
MGRIKALPLLIAVATGVIAWACGARTPTPAPAPTPTQTEAIVSAVVWELFTDVDYRGPVQRGAVREQGPVAYLATMATLYRVENGRAQPIAERPEDEARLALAPNGGVYAWLIPVSGWQGLFFVRLMDISGGQVAELKLDEFPYGFSALYLGFEGKLIVTVSPLSDWEGLEGGFLYTFWSRQGEKLWEVVLPRQLGFPDSTGTAIVLLGEERAMAFSASGKELWQLVGHFRSAASARNGELALLNPAEAEAIDQVLIFDGSAEPTVVEVPTPVHDLIILPDGSLAVVVGDRGRYFYLDPVTAELQEGQPLPLDGTFYISDAEFLDSQTLALGVLHRVGDPPEHTWPSGTIIVVNHAGEVAFQQDFPIREGIAYIPAIDVAFGSQVFVGFTEDTTILVDLGR